MKSKFILFLLVFCGILSNAQNEFVTIWKPGNPSTLTIKGGIPSTSNQIWFPGIGNNYNIQWEEVGYPAHSGTIDNITSTINVLIDFGTPQNPIAANATYKVKVNNGIGSFNQIKFANQVIISPSIGIPMIFNDIGDFEKIIEVSQWGNINWQTMEWAFIKCKNMDVTAVDIPNLSNVESTSLMFHDCISLIGNPTFNLWNTSNVKNMSHMFSSAGVFNQPISSWDTSNVTDMQWMFHYLSAFNQPVGNWNVSKVTTMLHMFHLCTSFNQDVNSWNTANVMNMRDLFEGATSFNQSLSNWNLNSLQFAGNMLHNTGLDCANYDATLSGWSANPLTPNNIDLGLVSNLIYANPAAVTARNNLINNKNWMFSGDQYDPNCETRLSTIEIKNLSDFIIYPNPATDILNIKTNLTVIEATVIDSSGRLLLKVKNPSNKIDVSKLSTGNYILQLTSKENSKSFKFIKK